MAATSTRADCGTDMNKQDGPMPPPGAPPAAPPMDPAKELEMLKAENARLKEQLAKVAGAQDTAAPPGGAAVPRALDAADEDEEEMQPGLAQDSKARMDALVKLELERRDLQTRAKRIGVSVRSDAKRSEIKRAIVEHYDGKLPQERVDSLDAKTKRGYISALYDVVTKRTDSASDAEARARGGSPNDRADAGSQLTEYDLQNQMVERNRALSQHHKGN